jgi:hypothetical protein
MACRDGAVQVSNPAIGPRLRARAAVGDGEDVGDGVDTGVAAGDGVGAGAGVADGPPDGFTGAFTGAFTDAFTYGFVDGVMDGVAILTICDISLGRTGSGTGADCGTT